MPDRIVNRVVFWIFRSEKKFLLLRIVIFEMKNQDTQKKNMSLISPLCVLAAGILWGCMGLLVRSMTPWGFTSMEVVIFRAITTGVLMFLFMLIFRRGELKVRAKDFWCFVGTGIASMVFFNTCYFSCMKYTTLSVAAILLYTAPSFLMIMSAILFKEKFTPVKVLCLVLAFAGCVLVSGGLPVGELFGKTAGISGVTGAGAVGAAGTGISIIGGADGPTAIFLAGRLGLKGLLLGLGAGFGYALYSVFGRYAIERGYSSFTITTYTFLFAALGCAPFIKWPHFIECLGGSVSRWPIFLGLTVATTIVAYLLYTKGLSGMENGMAGIIASIEPVVASLVGVLVFHEKLTAMGIAGMALVLGSCVLVSLPQKTEKKLGTGL